MSKAHATIAGLSLLLLASSDTFAQQPPAIPVSVVAAEKRPLSDTNRFVGKVEVIERVDVRARITRLSLCALHFLISRCSRRRIVTLEG